LKKILLLLFVLVASPAFSQTGDRPNVILIITDDQGYGDLGFTGNPHIRTPVLDSLAESSIRFRNFYVSPVCAPTRASLMTGRYSLRTGVRDTYNGGAMMAASEITLAEMLKEGGYRTGIFGKWHLGDNYPMRPMDQGFNQSVVHLAGGMGQVGDFTTWFEGDRSYFDPVLWHNGERESYEGYCSDIFTDRALEFIEGNDSRPFFCYLSFNAPHTPLQVPEEYYRIYADVDPSTGFDAKELPDGMSEKDKEDARKVYAMVSNIDHNVGRLMQKLEALQLRDNTIVIFMTDNGPQQPRYVAGMRGRKGSVYRGGVRVPFYLSYPSKFRGDSDVSANAAHIDVLPTLAELCGTEVPSDRKIDGLSLVPLIEGKSVERERPLFFYWSRKYPERYSNVAVQKESHKLVAHNDYDAPIEAYELFDIEKDPNEQNNMVLQNKHLADDLQSEMQKWFDTLVQSVNLLNPPRIHIGKERENPVFLNRNDASGERGIWAQEEIYGKWAVKIAEGRYDITFKFIEPINAGGKMYLETGTLVHQMQNQAHGTDVLKMENVHLPALEGDFIPFYAVDDRRILPFWVEVERRE
jgi:arylsulfatase